MRTAVYLEHGAKRVFACALDWPGWCRSGKSAEAALEALGSYADRYAKVAGRAGLEFVPADPVFTVSETVPGNSTTDFGAPDAVPHADLRPVSAAEAARDAALLMAAWSIFDETVAASPAELRKGPRGGGRDRDPMVAHVLGAEAGYARKIGVRFRPPAPGDIDAVAALRAAIIDVLAKPSDGGPLVLPKGWPARYAARRLAWHVLDHAWEMTDRSAP